MEALNRLPDNSDNCLARKTRYEPCLSVSLTYITALPYTLAPSCPLLLSAPVVLHALQHAVFDFIDSDDEIVVSCTDFRSINSLNKD